MASYSATILCTADTFTSMNGSQQSNFGNSPFTRVYEAYKMFSYFGFDLSSIPADKIITSIDFYFMVNQFFTVASGSDGSEFSTEWVYPVKCRRLYNTPFNTLESTLTHYSNSQNDTPENIYKYNSNANDSSINISAMEGYYASVPVNDITRTEDNKIILGLRVDSSYVPSSRKVQSCFAQISSREGSYTPYLVVYYEDPAPQVPTDLVPSNTVRNYQGSITLGWKTESLQKSYQVQYSTNNFQTYTTVSGNTSNQNHTIPANTFSNGQTVSWRVRIMDFTDTYSNYSSIVSFSIGATTPSAPEQVSPNNTVNSKDDIYFRWRFQDAYGYTQARYDLQYRKGSEPEITVSNNSTNQLHIMPRDTISGGTYSWRVRCYNAFGEVSPFSEWMSFYSIGAPQTPIITSITNNMNPTVTWLSQEQDLYTLRIYKNNEVVYVSAEQPSAAQHTITDYLEDGAYRAGLQISNVYGFWSAEASYNFTISTMKPGKPNIYGNGTEELTVTLFIESNTGKNVIYRKGIRDTVFFQIGEATGNTYIDYTAPHGENLYFARAVNTTGFNDSDTITASLDFDGIILSDYKDLKNNINLWATMNADKRKTISLAKSQYTAFCVGRIYPVVQSTDFKEHSEAHEYAITQEEFEKAYQILNLDIAMYRNDKGYVFPVQITSIGIAENEVDYYIVTFTVNRVEGE